MPAGTNGSSQASTSASSWNDDSPSSENSGRARQRWLAIGFLSSRNRRCRRLSEAISRPSAAMKIEAKRKTSPGGRLGKLGMIGPKKVRAGGRRRAGGYFQDTFPIQSRSKLVRLRGETRVCEWQI